jgi:hypothetical protein
LDDRKVHPDGPEVDPETFRTTFEDFWRPVQSFPALPESSPADPDVRVLNAYDSAACILPPTFDP